MSAGSIEFIPLSLGNWDDLVTFFSDHGNPNYCWCTFWRLSSAGYSQSNRAGRKRELEKIVRAGTPTGILGYRQDKVIGWCSVAPRESYSRLERARSIVRVDDRATWSIVCFYIDSAYQGQGFSSRFVNAAVDYAVSQGAEVVEAYPVEPEYDDAGNWHPAKSYRFMGYRSTFERAGFHDVTPPASRRVVMRCKATSQAGPSRS